MRALESCLRVERKGVRVEVLVIDGNSTDGSFAELQERYSADPRVRAVRQEGPEGFMPACFFALPQGRTPFVTFMYDDDVLSPFWSELVAGLERWRADFGFVFSADGDLSQAVPFAPGAQ